MVKRGFVSLKSEEWRPVLTSGYEDCYAVSNWGRVMRTKGAYKSTTFAGKILKPQPMPNGYVQYMFSVSGVYKRVYAHRLVLESFVSGVPTVMEACHNNGFRDDNRLENLRWDTRKANHYDKKIHGTHSQSLKTHCPWGHDYVPENLNVSHLNRGGRVCRACSLTQSYIRKGYASPKDKQKISDMKYELILKGKL